MKFIPQTFAHQAPNNTLFQIAPTQVSLINNFDHLQASNAINIIFKNISYTVEVDKKTDSHQNPFKIEKQSKTILKNVTGIFKSGEISAILGPSGAGKTSLLNIIACRISHLSKGKLMANTVQYGYHQFGDFANYVMQTDLLMQTLTVRETLTFAADLKINESSEYKSKQIEHLSKSMKLENCMDVMVGGQLLKGISGGQKKRTSIAFELIGNPQVIMLDEPTSGLDSLTSYIIIDYLTKLAHEHGKTVLMTIHQPNSDIYNKIDRLFFMIEGRIVYQGPTNLVLNYFNDNFGLKCGQFVNPAEFLIHNLHSQKPQNVQKFPAFYESYQTIMLPIVLQQIERSDRIGIQKPQNNISFMTVFLTLLKRDMKNIIRNPMLSKSMVFQAITMGLYAGGLYWNAGKGDYTDKKSWLSIIGFLFYINIAAMMSALTPVALVFPMERAVFLKQQSSRLYTVFLYFLSRNVIQLPFLIIMPILHILVLYWMVGLSSTAEQFFLYLLIFFLVHLCGDSIGLLIGSMINDAKSVSTVIPIIYTPLVLISGFFKNSSNLPSWVGWAQYISPLKYGFTAMTINEAKYRNSLINQLSFDVSFWTSVGLLVALLLGFRLLSLFFLWLLRKRIE